MSSSAPFESDSYYDVTKYGSASNLDGNKSAGSLGRSPTAYSRYSYPEASGFPAQRQKAKASTTVADRYYDTTSYNKGNSSDNYSNGTSGRESRVDFRVKKTSDQGTGSSGFPAQRPPNQSSMRASASMNNLRQDTNDGPGSRATTTTEQDFRYSNDSASLSRSDPFYRDTSVNIATSGAREFSPEKRESFTSYDHSPKESGYDSSASVNLRASDANPRAQSAARFTSEYRDLYRDSALDLRSPQSNFARSTSYY